MTHENDVRLRADLESIREEIEGLLTSEQELVNQLAFTRARIESLRKVDDSIGELLGEQYESKSVGITDAIRKVFNSKKLGTKITPVHVRTCLQEMNFPLADYKNALAVIHTTMKR